MRCPALINLPPSPPTKAGWPWTQENPGLPEATPDGRPWPTISIVTPNYNYGRFIEETIRSVLLQGYPALEYIIIDGGSSDGSIDIIRKYERRLAFWTSEKDQGQSSAINKGFSKATGEIFAWLNSDDILCPDALHKVAMYWRKHSNCHFLTGDGEVTDSVLQNREQYIKTPDYSLRDLFYFHRGKYLPQSSVFFSREAFLEAGGLDRRLYYTMDLDLWIRLRKKHTLYYVPACLSKARHHKDARTWKDPDIVAGEAKDVIRKYFDTMNFSSRLLVRVELAFFFAAAICRKGLQEYSDENRNGAIRSLKRALRVNPAILFSLTGMKLFLMFILPGIAKKIPRGG